MELQFQWWHGYVLSLLVSFLLYRYGVKLRLKRNPNDLAPMFELAVILLIPYFNVIFGILIVIFNLDIAFDWSKFDEWSNRLDVKFHNFFAGIFGAKKITEIRKIK